MIVALVVIAALWIVAGAVVMTATRKPADMVVLALADTTPVRVEQPLGLAA